MGVNGIYGLSGSGLDIESMVKVGMMGKQSQLDKMQQKYDLATWKKEAMSSIYSDLSTMNYSTLSQYKLQSSMNAMSATSSDESIVKVTANGSAASMSHTVTVGGLSTNAYLITGNDGIHRNNTDAAKKSSIYLSDNLFSTGNAKTGDATVYTLGGKDYLSSERVGTATTYSLDAPVYAIGGKEYLSVAAAGTTEEYRLDTPVYSLGGQEYTNAEKAGSTRTYWFKCTGNSAYSMEVRETVGANNQVTYERKNGNNWELLTGTDADNAKAMINDKTEKLTLPSGSNGAMRYFMQDRLMSATDNYKFTAENGSEKTFSFTTNAGATAYQKTYQDANGTSYTADVDSIALNFSNLARNSEEHALTVRKLTDTGGNAVYQKRDGDNWTELTGNDKTAVAGLIEGTAEKVKIGDRYYNSKTNTENIVDYTFTSGDGTQETYSFTPLDTDHPDTTAYGKTYKDASGTSYTADADTIAHDFSNLIQNSTEHALSVRKLVDAENHAVYQKQDGTGWVDLEGDEAAAVAALLDGSAGDAKVRIGGWDYNHPDPTGETVEYAWTGADGTKDNFSFTALDPDHPDTTAYSSTYKDGNGTSYTADVDQIEHDFSNMVNGEKFMSHGRIAGNDDVAVSFTVMDGSEDFSDMTAEEIADFKKKRTITYTYAQLADGGKTYNDLAADINALGTNIKASYDAANDSFSLSNKNSGEKNQIQLTMNTELAADLFNNLGLMQSKNGVLSKLDSDQSSTAAYDPFAMGQTAAAKGDSGKITIDGKTYNNVEDNRITVDGVTYQLQNVSSGTSTGTTYNFSGTDADGKAISGTLQEASGASKTVNVVINQDTDAIIDKVKSFVEDYNKLLDSLYEKYSETKYTDYKPLTESQRDKMTDKQIEKWEEKAKSGTLYHDYTIGKIIDRMRQAVSTPVEGLDTKYNSAYALGVYTSKTNGHLSLDEDRLKKALAEDPEAAYKVFGTLPQSDSKGNYDYDQMGVAQRLGDVMVQAMKDVKTEAGESADISDGSNLGNKLMEFQQKMSDFKTLMSAFETQLFKKYDAMESLLATLGTQLNFITGGQ